MRQNALWSLLVALIISGSIFAYRTQDPSPMPILHDIPAGDYQYACDQNIGFVMSLSSDMSTMRLTAVGTSTFISATLSPVAATSGVRYEGAGVVFLGHGESVSITTASTVFSCLPVQSPDEAPFNFGD